MKSWAMPNDEMPAAGREGVHATSLYFAAARWGNGRAFMNYRAEADRLIGDLIHREFITGPTLKGKMTGDRCLIRSGKWSASPRMPSTGTAPTILSSSGLL